MRHYVTHIWYQLRDLCVVRWSFFWEVCFEEGAVDLFSLMWFPRFSTHCYQMVNLESFKLSKNWPKTVLSPQYQVA